MTPDQIQAQIQAWQATILAGITAFGVVAAALIGLAFSLIGGVKAKQKEMQTQQTATDAQASKTAQHVAENYGTLTALDKRVEAQSANLRQQTANVTELAKAMPPAAPVAPVAPTVVVNPPPHP